MEKLESYLDLKLVERNPEIALLEMAGFTLEELKSVTKQITFWKETISIHVMSLSIENVDGVPASPVHLYLDVCQFMDNEFPHRTVIARGMFWSSVCTILLNYANEEMCDRLHEKALKDSGIGSVRDMIRDALQNLKRKGDTESPADET